MFISFLFIFFFSFWGFSVYRMQICFSFKNFSFFLRPDLEFRPVFIKMSRNTRYKPKWPEIFSKWNRNTLDKILRVVTGQQHDEIVAHVLQKCPLARNVWATVRGKLQKCNSEAPNFYTLARQMEEKLPKKDLEVWALVSWSIWNARNRFHFEEKQSMPSDILNGAMTLLEEYQELCKTSTSAWECAKAHKSWSFSKFFHHLYCELYFFTYGTVLCPTLVRTWAGYTKPRLH